MSVKIKISALIELIEKNSKVLERMEQFYDHYTGSEMAGRESKLADAIVISDILVNYYTCLETIFLRISQFFENDLLQDRWHQDLLEKMTIKIDDLREAVISDETYRILTELLKFRHFKRYYFELGYDWDKLEFLQKKCRAVRPLVHRDLKAFVSFLRKLT